MGDDRGGLSAAVEAAKELLTLFDHAPVSRVRIRAGETSVELRSGSATPGQPDSGAPPPAAAATAAHEERRTEPHSGPANPATVRAPAVGVFHSRPSPEEPPFTEVGTRVDAGDQVALIEAMKTFTPVFTEHAGVVREICAEDKQVVEYDEPLVILEPDPDDGQE